MDSGVLFTVFMPAQPHLSPTDVVDYLMCWYFLRAPHLKVHEIPTQLICPTLGMSSMELNESGQMIVVSYSDTCVL